MLLRFIPLFATLRRSFFTKMPSTFGYWKTRAYGVPIQYLLEYVGEPYEMKWYDFGSPPDYKGEDWYKEKFTLGLDFPNVPYYIEDGTKLTQSLAIMRYLGRKYNIAGKTEKEKQWIDMAELQALDLRLAFMNVFNQNWNEEGRKKFMSSDERENLPLFLKLFDDFLKGKKFLVGDEVTYPDFLLYEDLEWALFGFPHSLHEYENVKDYWHRMHNLPSMQAFRESPKFVFWPLTGPGYGFGWEEKDLKLRFPDKTTIQTMPPIIGYWDIRAFVTPIQYLLEYVGEDYEMKWYHIGADLNPSEWFGEKNKLGLDFPNLPYYLDGDLKLTQSLAIMRHIARRNNLDGRTEQQKVLVDMTEMQALDLRMALVYLYYQKWTEKDREHFLTPNHKGSLPSYLETFNAYLQKQTYLAGDEVTFPDFLLYETLEWVLFGFPASLDPYQALKDYHKKINDLPSMQRFRQSKNYRSWPLTAPVAQFGFKEEDRKLRFPDA
ncbi:unnamed protein product [Cyprideis torosa]|uniref:glutathione transferase n=1 Tax=Cyprideis torosa TaxID=163714 RepID=A0A7R8W5J9_9CRUS|nr:unnamed protein product [Cyprideis torosa]CAG0885300.1 unnamed protein product [Cyprideis torosa]